ncbi:MAG: acyl-ACP--UDP-N-acetylglucosamine O-acyltransferase [Acidobacteria bacterium]|nr:acyl-ACP--UDP-N-acetylglucosamine O-acyltransferase [Acidobacteriota bacterium]
MPVHPSAVVHAGAKIHSTAQIGPFCSIGDEVEIGPGSKLLANIYVEGPTTIGADNVFQPFSTVGVAPQDLKYHGERAETVIGDRNLIREFVTIHRGTEGGGTITQIGDDNLLQAYAHVAHDCVVGSHCILAHGATLGGHVTIEDWAVVGAQSGVHQFCRVGAHSYIGGYSVITQDVMPFSVVVSDRGAKAYSVNKVGLERRGFTAEEVQRLHKTVRILTKSGLNTEQALERIEAEVDHDEHVARLLDFIRSSKRGVVK